MTGPGALSGPVAGTLVPPSPGLARGTLIATRRGPVPVEALRPGDKVQTLDDGLCPVLWLGHWRAPGSGARAPVRIAAGVLGNSRPMLLGPGQGVLIRPSAGPLADQEVLVAAAALAGLPGIARAPQPRLEWFAPVFALHAVIFAEDARLDSLLPQPRLLAALMPAERETLSARLAETPGGVLPARPIVPAARAGRLILRHRLALGVPQSGAADRSENPGRVHLGSGQGLGASGDGTGTSRAGDAAAVPAPDPGATAVARRPDPGPHCLPGADAGPSGREAGAQPPWRRTGSARP